MKKSKQDVYLLGVDSVSTATGVDFLAAVNRGNRLYLSYVIVSVKRKQFSVSVFLFTILYKCMYLIEEALSRSEVSHLSLLNKICRDQPTLSTK